MIKVETNCSSKMTDEEMRRVQGMGIEYLAANFVGEDACYDGIVRFQERAARYGLKISNAGCPQLQKCPSIHLGKPDRDEWIEKYNEFTRALGKAGVSVNYIAWQPNGIFRTKIGAGKYNHSQNSFLCDLDEIKARPIANDREYGEDEIWSNFQYFLDKALPVCEEANVKLALHPNDPPIESVGGVHCLIWNSDCYRRAFRMAHNSPYLTMKMCVGCWLESESFGDLYKDIDEFVKADKIPIIHFRNVSGALPYFEETLLEDGCEDMYALMKHIVRSGFDGFLNIDHAFFNEDGKGMNEVSTAYYTGYMKALLHAAEKECAAEK